MINDRTATVVYKLANSNFNSLELTATKDF